MLLQSLIINVNINLLFWRSTVKNLPIHFNDGWPYSDPLTWVTMRILALQYCGWADDSSESIQYSEKSRPDPIYALNKTLNFLPFQSAWKRNTVIFFLFCDNGDFNRAHHNFKYTVLVSNGGQLCMNNERGQFNRLKSKKAYSNSTFIIYILDAVMCNYLIN